MLEKLTKILREYKENDSLTITEDTLFTALEFDSLELAELIMLIEEEMNLSLDIDENIKTAGDLIKLIEAASN